MKAIHLGDGAYAAIDRHTGALITLANDHEPSRATDIVHFDNYAICGLLKFIKINYPNLWESQCD